MQIIRLGVIGMGQRTMFHGWAKEMREAAKACPEKFEVAALCDIRSDRLEAAGKGFRAELGIEAALFTDYRQMLRDAKLDAVYVASPNYLHAEMSMRCFEAGCDVLCEKPMATTIADARLMVAAAEKHQRLLGVGMQMHYRERYHRVAAMIREGRIGQPVMAWCTEFRGPFIEMKDWVWEQAKSGGAVVEKNCHHVDILDLFAVGGRPTRVYATGGQMRYAEIYGRKSEIVDHAWAVWDYDNGLKGMIGVSFVNGHIHEREFGVAGTEGLLRFSLADGEIVHLQTNDGRKEDVTVPGVLRGGLFADFLRCVKTRETPLVTPEMGLRSLLVPLAAERSIAERRPVDVGELG